VSERPLAPVPEFPRRLVYLGTPDMAVPPLQTLISNGFDVALVVTGADKRRGRGSELSPSPVKAAALDLGVPVSHRVDDVLEVGADLGVVVAFGKLIRRPVLELLPMVNIHFSLLPRWRGAAPVERALLAGDTRTGTCLMQLEEGLDTGPVFDRVEVPIGAQETAESLRASLVSAGCEQLIRCLRDGLRHPVAQVGEATYAAKIQPEEWRIDWSHRADEVGRLVRLGAAWTTFRGKRVRVLAAQADTSGTSAGVVHGRMDGQRVACGGDTWLLLDMVQPEGKAPMAASAWLNGARPTAGDVLGA